MSQNLVLNLLQCRMTTPVTSSVFIIYLLTLFPRLFIFKPSPRRFTGVRGLKDGVWGAREGARTLPTCRGLARTHMPRMYRPTLPVRCQRRGRPRWCLSRKHKLQHQRWYTCPAPWRKSPRTLPVSCASYRRMGPRQCGRARRHALDRPGGTLRSQWECC